MTISITGNGNGHESVRAYFAVPQSGTGPAVLMLHAWWGLNRFIELLCDRLAAEGFVVLAPDLVGGRIAATVAEAEHIVKTAEADGGARGMQIIDAAIDALLRHEAVSSASIGVVGFSFGAYYALNASVTRPDDVAAVVVFYGTSDHDFAAARCAYLGHYAENDPYEEAKWVNALETRIRDSGNAVTFHTYPGAGHWFAENDRADAFDPAAAELAWQRTVGFLREPRSCE